jgi:hypothetical protein
MLKIFAVVAWQNNGDVIRLGWYENEKEANDAYNTAAKKMVENDHDKIVLLTQSKITESTRPMGELVNEEQAAVYSQIVD